MSLCLATAAPPAVLWFTRLFFFRRPLADEVPEIEAALRLMRRRAGWLVLVYLAYVGLLVVPGLLRDKGAAYALTAVLLPHVALYLLLMMTAYGWVGFRINLGNLREFITLYKRRQNMRATAIAVLVSMIAGGIVGYTAASTGSLLAPSISEWFNDTFTPGLLVLLFFVLITALPELIAQLRLRQHELSQQLLAAQTAGERLARQTAESELRLLQAQVEPHFLYNTLANLRYLVQTGSAEALRMTDALIEYLRTAVPDMRAQRVTLGREADHAGHYLEIMRMRMGGRLVYEIDVPDELRPIELPPLVLLTLVENAIKHGIGPRIDGGRVSVRARAEGDRVRIEVADDGVGVEAQSRSDAPSSGAGLRNVAGRLKLVYGEAASFALEPGTPQGTSATLVLPRMAPPPPPAQVDVLVPTPEEEPARGLVPPATTAAP